MRLTYGRSKDDPEKLVTPGVLFCKKSGDGVTAYLLALGWWDFSVKLLWVRRTDAPANTDPT